MTGVDFHFSHLLRIQGSILTLLTGLWAPAASPCSLAVSTILHTHPFSEVSTWTCWQQGMVDTPILFELLDVPSFHLSPEMFKVTFPPLFYFICFIFFLSTSHFPSLDYVSRGTKAIAIESESSRLDPARQYIG